MQGSKENKIEVKWWVHEIDLLNHDTLIQHYKNFNTVDKAIQYALKLKEDQHIESFEIRFY